MQFIPRSARRVPVTLTARCRVCRQNYALNLLDLSEYGCKLAISPFDIRAGDRICLRPAELEGEWGDVVWVEGGAAGIRFDRTLHPAVVDHLARKYGKAQSQSAVRHEANNPPRPYRMPV